MSTGFYNNRFDGVQVLRALAAFSVVINHMAFVENGGFGVDIFFCISGFIMMYVTEKGAHHFISKRIIRIIPLYYLISIFTFVCALLIPSLFEKTAMSPVFLVKSMLFIPFDIGNGVIQPIVRVGWTLNYEVFFYLILWISLHINHKFRAFIASGIIMLLVISGMVFDNKFIPFEYWSDSIMIEFIFGMIAYTSVKNLTKCLDFDNSKVAYRFVMLVPALLMYIFMWSVKYKAIFDDVPRFIIFGIPAFVIFLTVFLATYGCKLPKILVYLGDISYSVYLLHYFIVRLFNHYICPDGVADAVTIIIAAFLILIIIAVSSVSYYVIEKKCSALLKRLLNI